MRCPWVCELTNHPGYVLYSALGSFYLPMFVMLFFYWRIYRAAVQTTKAINQVSTFLILFNNKKLLFSHARDVYNYLYFGYKMCR